MITAATEPDVKHGLAAFRKFFFGGLKRGADDNHIGGVVAGGWTFAVTSYNASYSHNIPEYCTLSSCCEVFVSGHKGAQEIIVSYVVGTRLRDKSLDGNSDADYESVVVSSVVRPSTAPIADVVLADGKSAVRALGNALRMDKAFDLNPKLVLMALLGHTLKVCKSIFGDRAVAAVSSDAQPSEATSASEPVPEHNIAKIIAGLSKPVTVKLPSGFKIEVTPHSTYWEVAAFFERGGSSYVARLFVIGANVMFYGQHRAKYTWFFINHVSAGVRDVLMELAHALEQRLVHKHGEQTSEINYAITKIPDPATAAAEVDPNALPVKVQEKFKSFGAYWSWLCSYFSNYDSGHQNYGRGFKYKNLRVRAVKNNVEQLHLAIESKPACALFVDRPLLAGEDQGFAAKSAVLELRFAGGWRKSVKVDVKCNTSPAEFMRIVFKHLPDGVATAATEPVPTGVAHAKLVRLHDSIKGKPPVTLPLDSRRHVRITTNFAFETNKHIDVDVLDEDGYNLGRVVFFCAPRQGSDRVLCSFTQGGMRDEARDFAVTEHELMRMKDSKSTLKFLVDKAKAMLFPKPPYRPTAAAEPTKNTDTGSFDACVRELALRPQSRATFKYKGVSLCLQKLAHFTPIVCLYREDAMAGDVALRFAKGLNDQRGETVRVYREYTQRDGRSAITRLTTVPNSLFMDCTSLSSFAKILCGVRYGKGTAVDRFLFPASATAAAEVEPDTTVQLWKEITKKIGSGVDVTFSGKKYRIVADSPGDIWSEISVRTSDARIFFFANLIDHKLTISVTSSGNDHELSFEKTQSMLKLGSKFLPALLHTALEQIKGKGVTAAVETVPVPGDASERLPRTFQQLVDLLPAEGRRGSVRINGVAFSYCVQPRKRRGPGLEVEMRRESDDSPAGGFGVEAHGGSLLFSGASFSETVDVLSHAAVTSVRGLFEGLVSMFPEVLPEFYPRFYGRRRTAGKLKITAATEPVPVPLKCLDVPVYLSITVDGLSVVVRRREERTGTHARNTWVVDVSGDARSPSYVVYDGISENDNGRAYNVFREVSAHRDVFVGGIDAVTVKSVRDLVQRIISLCVKNAKKLKGMRTAQAAAEHPPHSISGFLTGNDRFSASKGNMSIVAESDARTPATVRVLGHSWNVTVSSGAKKRRYVVSFGKPLESDGCGYLVRLNEPRKYPEILAYIQHAQVKSGKELFLRAASVCFAEAAALWGTAQAASEPEPTSHLMDLVGKLQPSTDRLYQNIKTVDIAPYRIQYGAGVEDVRFSVNFIKHQIDRDLGLYSLCLDHKTGKPQILKEDGKDRPWKLVRKIENRSTAADLLKVALAVIIKHVKDNDEF